MLYICTKFHENTCMAQSYEVITIFILNITKENNYSKNEGEAEHERLLEDWLVLSNFQCRGVLQFGLQ